MSIRPLTLEEYQVLIQVSLRKKSPSIWFRNARFLNIYTGQIEEGQIYVEGNRIAYVGPEEPLLSDETEVVELLGEQVLVPGYIEPHAHPFQWYNPFEWGKYLTKQGTTTSINDNMYLFRLLDDNQVYTLVERLDQEGFHLWLWWSRFDNQTNTGQDSKRFSDQTLQKWLSHPLVVQGGEFTNWPYFLQGDHSLAQKMLLTKQTYNKRIEGHLPGASLGTLNALAAAGVSADHEALNGEDVIKRIQVGMYATLRYSSIRPDLPQILAEIKENKSLNINRIMLTNDGASPFFVNQSGVDQMIKIVMDAGFSEVDAYRMATLNPATYYRLDQELGGIAPGRLAHINILEQIQNPTPVHVMVDGKWMVQNKESNIKSTGEWMKDYFSPIKPSWIYEKEKINNLLQVKDQGNMGIELINEVITKPYSYDPQQALEENEAYLFRVDSDGHYVIPTRLKNFSRNMTALASTYTADKAYILIGKNREEMVSCLTRAIDMGGGLVVSFDGVEKKLEIPLPLAGGMSDLSMEDLIVLSEMFISKLQEHGHSFADPIYTLLFLTATHLPFVRLTEEGVYLIKEQKFVSSRQAL